MFQGIGIIVPDGFLCSNHRLKGWRKGGMDFYLREIKNAFFLIANGRHKQIEIRATVSPAPYSKVVRESYAKGWRTAQV